MMLPKHIKDKIKRIVTKHHEIISLMNDITEWNSKLKEPVKALDEGWDWQMYFTGPPKEINEKEIEAVILTALTGKIHKVDYGGKTITLSELMKQSGK